MAVDSPTRISGDTVDSIKNAVRPIKLSGRTPARNTVNGERFGASAAVCSVIIYLVAVLAGSQSYDSFRRHAADPLPAQADVLMAGSSVIAVPLIVHEYPNKDVRIVLDRLAVMRTPKAEHFLAALGVPKLMVYNGSAIGQSIEETEQFVQGIIGLQKHPRLLILWVAPVSVVVRKPAQIAYKEPTLVEKVDSHLMKLWREHRDAPVYIQMVLSHYTCWLYSKLGLGYGSRAAYYQGCQNFYQELYRGVISKQKLETFARILKICKDHAIKTMVVSTPLAPSNRSLFPPGLYDQYHRAMNEIVQNSRDNARKGEAFIDLGRSAEYQEGSDFRDPAHCNENGCEKMLRAIAPQLCKEFR